MEAIYDTFLLTRESATVVCPDQRTEASSSASSTGSSKKSDICAKLITTRNGLKEGKDKSLRNEIILVLQLQLSCCLSPNRR